MKYFVKSQEKDILLLPVINEEQDGNTGDNKQSLSTWWLAWTVDLVAQSGN